MVKTGIKLHRFCGVIPTDSDVTVLNTVDQIQKNLEPLLNNNKKQVAQEIYYANRPDHQSPLKREEKGPVHTRLGLKTARKRLMPLGTNTTSVLPKRRINKQPAYNIRSRNGFGIQNRPQFKRSHRPPFFSAQNRLDRIRAQQTGGTPIKLRRFNRLQPATNLTVQVKNTNFVANESFDPVVPRFKMVLDLQVQEQIAEIQQQSRESVGVLPINTRIIPATTNVTTSYRFGLL